ncbi:Ulp1 family isopeptidase [Wolbachia endosymbiont of Oedothorax gibbosus]|uniref:Ulp1 family isopeptidase n=1 Tax=Wolbachia endosymbiont of Oedothorax gibbosus TaxID=931100 RepID=UPI00202429C4|nr:Ulp1 family isopeptidase [Wolbachia endosymbiont of Oedothorax gibbosus]
MLISLTVVPIFPFALLAFNPIAWAMLGVAFIVLSGAAMSIASPLFHWAVDEGKKQPESELNKNVEVESPSSLLSNIDVSKNKLFYSKEYDTLVHNTNNGNYTRWLTSYEIPDIAKAVYGYDVELNFENDVELLNPSYSIVFDVIHPNIEPTSHENIEFAIGGHCKRYQEEVKEEGGPRIMTLILNLSSHFVTLVTAYDKENGNFRAYYCNSFGSTLQSEISNFLKQELGLKEENIRSCKVRQQNNDYDCGIYALENANRITDMMKAGKSFDEIDKELAEYVYKDQEQEETRLQGKRKEFAEALMKSVADKSDSELDKKFKYWGYKTVKEKAAVNSAQ